MYYLANFSHGARSIESYNYQFGPYPKRVTCATCQVYSIFIFLQDTFFKNLKRYQASLSPRWKKILHFLRKNIFLGKHTNCDSNWRNYSTSSMVDGCTFMYVRVNSTLLPTYFEIYHIVLSHISTWSLNLQNGFHLSHFWEISEYMVLDSGKCQITNLDFR